LVLDDFGNKTLSADFVINGNLAKQHCQYEQPDGHCQKLYCGADYCVIGQRFFDRRSQWVSPAVDKVLITFGGSDPTGITEKTVRALSGVSSLKTVTVLAGPGYQHNDRLHHVIKAASGPKFYLKENVPDIVSEFLEADVVIAAGGRTAYELAAMGKPAILIPSIDHEVSTAVALEELGASVNLGPWGRSSAIRLSQVLRELNEKARRERMLKCGRAIFDGKALNRVCAVIDGMA